MVLISDQKVMKIPVHENNEPLTDLRKFPQLRIDHREKKNSDTYYKLRSSVADKLIEAQSYLPNEMRLLIIEGLRTPPLQKKYFDSYSQNLATQYPEWERDKVYLEASKFVAPPESAPHTTGGAVDLTLADRNGLEIDMGTKYDANPIVSKNTCFTKAQNITKEAKTNRKILIDVLSGAGFVNYPFEWWHWSYGDRYWAYHAKKPFAIFGTVN